MDKRVYLLVGPYTLKGGVNIHITRLSNLLERNYIFKFINESSKKAHRFNVFDLRTYNLFTYFKFIHASHIVHIHSSFWWLRALHIISAKLFRRRIIVTIHSLSNLQTDFSIKATKYFLKFVDKTILVSSEIAKTISVENSVILNAFIPPEINSENNLPEAIIRVLEANKNKKIIVSNASDLAIHKGEDLYGLDLLIDVAKKIKNDGQNYIIIFVLASLSKNKKLLKNYLEKVKNEGLQKTISIFVSPISFVKLILESDLVVRATNTDGDALSVREAIYLKKPVIASDVVERPEKAILFSSRSSYSLYTKINYALNELQFVENRIVSREDFKGLYVNIVENNF